MKKLLNICISTLVLAGIGACGEKEPVWVAPTHTMAVEQSDLVFEPAGGSATFTVKAENPFTAATDRDWCTATVSGTEVAVTVTANPHNQTRYARVNLTSGDEKLGITVQQTGIIIKGFFPNDTLVGGGAHELHYQYTSNGGELSFSSTQEWITVAQAEGAVTVSVAANDAGVRTGTVSYTLGTLNGSFDIRQFPTFSVNAGWTPAYGGKSIYQDIVQDIFTVTVDPASAGATFATLMLSQADFNAKGMTMARYVETSGWSDALALLRQKVAATSGSALADFLHSDSVADTLAATAVPEGNCYLIAVGLTAEGEPTGKYASALLTLTAPSYASWIGNWAAKDSRGSTFTLAIAQKEAGVSYTVSGLKGYDLPMTALYNADGTFTLTGSSTVSIISASYTAGGYVYSNMYMLGAYSRNNTATVQTGSSFNVGFGAQRGGSEAVLMGHYAKVSNVWYPYVQVVLRGSAKKDGTGTASTRVLDRAYLPVTLTKE